MAFRRSRVQLPYSPPSFSPGFGRGFFMTTRSYSVYILKSQSTGRFFYVGHADDLVRRFNQHQSGYSVATRNRGPWIPMYTEQFTTKSEAAARE